MNAPVKFHSGAVWSLWDMVNNFSASRALEIASELHVMVLVASHNKKLVAQFGDARMSADPKVLRALREAVEQVETVGRMIEDLLLLMPGGHLRHAAKKLEAWGRRNDKKWDDLYAAAVGLRDAITIEFSEHIFYSYPKHKGEKFKAWQPEWEKIIAAFPDVLQESYSATDCYALQHNNASVFHSMRVAEHGLRALAKERGLRLPKSKPVEWGTWQEVIRALDNEIATIGRSAPGKAKDAALAFYSGARADLNGFKDEYRNSVMHVREDYDEFQALRALNQVREFMGRLAEKLDHNHRRIRWGRP